MKRKKYEPFLDIAMDVLYSIVLYTLFVAFPGLVIETWLMIFAAFLMINYWWAERESGNFPKYYLIDFYFSILVLFLFYLWSNYFLNVTYFLYVTTIFFFVDSVWSVVAIYAHKEKSDEPELKFYFATESILTVIYLVYSFILKSVDFISLMLIFAPYAVWYAMNIKKDLIEEKFS